MTARPCDIYLGGVRARCISLDVEDLPRDRWSAEAVRATGASDAPLAMARAAGASDAPLAMARIPGPAPDGWVPLRRGYARPQPAAPEPLEPLAEDHFAAMRGLYGLFAGAFPGMLARENPAEWEARLASLPNPLGLFDGERLLLWLAERDGELLELAAAPDALPRIPGALAAAKILCAPAPILGVPPEWTDESVKLLLTRPFFLPEQRIETPEQLARALDGAVQWD